MPGKKPYEAFSAFVEPLADALSCIAVTKIQTSDRGKESLDRVHQLHLTGVVNDGYVKLAGSAHLELRARMYYQIIRDDRDGYGPYRISTRGYDYSLCTADRAAILDFHWHPLGQSHETRPHVHIGSTQLRADSVLTNKQHIGTGRITFEGAIREALALGAGPVRADWDERLNACEGPHLAHRSWSIDYERETGQKIGG